MGAVCIPCVMADNNTSVILPYMLYGNITGNVSDGSLVKVVGTGVVFDWFNPVEIRNNTFGNSESLDDVLYVQGNITNGQNLTVYINDERVDINIDGVWYETIQYKSGMIDNVDLRIHAGINQTVNVTSTTVITTEPTTIPTTIIRTTRPTPVRTYPSSYVGIGGGGGGYILDYNIEPTETVVYTDIDVNQTSGAVDDVLLDVTVIQTFDNKESVISVNNISDENVNATTVENEDKYSCF